MVFVDTLTPTVLPKADHKVSADGHSMTYYAKTASRSRTFIAGFLAMPFVFVGALALLIGLPFTLTMGPKAAAGIGPVLLTVLACGGIAFVIYALGAIPKVIPIKFTRDAILFKGKRYLLDHVDYLGWRASGGYVSYGGAAQNTGAALGYALSGRVYMRYGAKEITLITGLHPERTESVYNDIVRFLQRMGRDFG
jgi:hypothetical protein